MSLETLYKDAAPNSYVGQVRTRQSSDAPTNGAPLVNFLDGNRRTGNATDIFQTEFKRNDPNSYVAGGVPKHPGGSRTRWTADAFKLAFDGKGPVSLSSGYYTSQFTSYNGKLVHKYTPNTLYGVENNSASKRINSSPSGAPTGL